MVTHGNDEEKRSRPEKSPEDSQAPLNEHEAVPQGADPQFALPASNQDSLCPTNIPGIRVDYFRPVEAVVELAGNHTPGSPEFELLREELSRLPPFLRVEEADLLRYAGNFKNVVNITGYSGQGVHPGQERLLKEAFASILADQGCAPDNTLLISGGTALGVPHAAIQILAKEDGFPAVGVMAYPAVQFPTTDGYHFICTSPKWMEWGSEQQTMAKVSNRTVIAGGGVQAFEDALIAAQEGEDISVVVNTYNQMVRYEYELDGKRGDVVSKANAPDLEHRSIISLDEIKGKMAEALEAQGMDSESARRARLCSLPVSGLVTEVRKGERRPCGQDLLYFAITGNGGLLPERFRGESKVEDDALCQKLARHLDLYYLFDDPNEGIFNSAVIKLNGALSSANTMLLDKLIDHAVEHDVHSPSTGIFGPPALGAKSSAELAQILKEALGRRLTSRAA